MKKWIALVLALVLALSLIACGPKAETTPGAVTDPGADIPEEQRYGGVLNTTWNSCSDTFDPHYTTGWVSYYWSFNVYETPIARDAEGNFVPCVCDFELNEDMTQLKLWVRDGVTFHDGSAVEIEDVVASIQRSCDLVPNMGKWFGDYVSDLTVSNGVATYTFSEFKVNTLMYLSGWQNWTGVIPKEICEKYGENPINQIEDAIGTGPYYLDEYQTNAVYKMKRYDAYVPTTLECDGFGSPKKAYLDQINVWINGDPTSVTMGTLNGDYDFGSLASDYLTMAESNGLVNEYGPASNIMGMSFNTKGDRPVNDVNLRLAIAYALDYAQISRAGTDDCYLEETCPMTGPYYTEVFNNAPYAGAADLEKAKEYLEKANYNGEEIILLATSDDGGAVIWEDNLKAVGINAKIEYMEFTTMKSYYADNSNPYDCVFYWYEVKDNVPCLLSATARERFWGSETKDELFDVISSTPAGSEESMAAWAELTQHWVDDCAVLNICTVPNINTYNADLVPNFPGLLTFWNAYWTNPAEHMG